MYCERQYDVNMLEGIFYVIYYNYLRKEEIKLFNIDKNKIYKSYKFFQCRDRFIF